MNFSTWPSYDVLATMQAQDREIQSTSVTRKLSPARSKLLLPFSRSLSYVDVGWCWKFGLHVQEQVFKKEQVFKTRLGIYSIGYLELRFSRCRRQLAELLEPGPSGLQSTKPAKFFTCKLHLAKTCQISVGPMQDSHSWYLWINVPPETFPKRGSRLACNVTDSLFNATRKLKHVQNTWNTTLRAWQNLVREVAAQNNSSTKA